jgi:hypothetical protein
VAQILVLWAGNRPSSNGSPGAPTTVGMRGWAWRIYLGAGALATGGYYLLSDGAGAVLNVADDALSGAGVMVRVSFDLPSAA